MSAGGRGRGDPVSRGRLSPVKIFVDRCIESQGVVEALTAAGMQVERHRTHFAHHLAAPDEEWLRLVGQRGWVGLTKDRAMVNRPLALHQILGAGIGLFVVTAGNVRGEQLSRIVSLAESNIIRLAQRQPPPFIAHVTISGGVRLVYRTAAQIRQALTRRTQ